MRKHHDSRKGIEVTEMTWAAAKGIVPPNAIFGMETTAKGQADRLKSSYRKLARYRRKMSITGVYWFTWATDYQTGGNPSSMSFRFSGLVTLRRRGLHARCRCSARTGAWRPSTRAAASPRALAPAPARSRA